MIPSKRVAFVEYDDDLQAGIALQGKLNNGIVINVIRITRKRFN